MFGNGFLGMVQIAGLGQSPSDAAKAYIKQKEIECAQYGPETDAYFRCLEEIRSMRRGLIYSVPQSRSTKWGGGGWSRPLDIPMSATSVRQGAAPLTSPATSFDWSQRAVPISAEAQRQATAYRPQRIPTTLPFGGSFWGGGATTTYT